jgi:hypothetical protein
MSTTTLQGLWAEVLTQSDLGAQRDDRLGGFRLGFTGENGRFLAFAKGDEERSIATFFSVAPFVVEPRHRDNVMRLVTRINFGLPVGCFEFDLDDGELRLRTTVAFGKAPRDRQLLEQSLWANVATMDRWLPGLVAAAQLGLKDEQAVALVESRSR